MELLVARMALRMMGYEAEIAVGVHATSIGGMRVDAVVTDAPPKVVATVLPGARWEPECGGQRAFF
jgi:hypothetical protein